MNTHRQKSVHLYSSGNISLIIVHTDLSLHESVEVAVPVSRVWLGHRHALKVKKRHHAVFGIAGHVDYLHKK